MSERVTYAFPERRWMMPDGFPHTDLEPLPCLVYSETEHEVMVRLYDRRKGSFGPIQERRVKTFSTFHQCRVCLTEHMMKGITAIRGDLLEACRIHSHLDNTMVGKYFPVDYEIEDEPEKPAKVESAKPKRGRRTSGKQANPNGTTSEGKPDTDAHSGAEVGEG